MIRLSKLAIGAALSLAAVFTLPVQAQTIALSFDDGPTIAPTPLLSPKQRNQAMLDALAKYRVKSVLFVTGSNGAHTPAGYALAKAWGDAGHLIGNHTMSHLDFNSEAVSLSQYQSEILACDAIIRTLPGYQKWFRYTYINLGNTPEKRAGMQGFLKQQGYRDAPVSFHVSDWEVDARLGALLKSDPKADLSAIKAAYLADVRKQSLANKDKGDRAEIQVLLLHHNLANALWLDEVIGVLAATGWKFAPASDVLASYRRSGAQRQ